MTPKELLAAADALLTGHRFHGWRCWQRACATLIRIALEHTLDDFWQRRGRANMIQASTRSQLLALPTVTDPETAAIVRTAWYGLCRAVHHHAYELAPTAAELRGWHSAVTQLAHRLNEPANVSSSPGEE